jgi:hypothetical protein
MPVSFGSSTPSSHKLGSSTVAKLYFGSSLVWPTDSVVSSTVLLMHFDGTGTSLADSAASPATITAYGDATQSTSVYKWGSASLALDGTGDYAVASHASKLAMTGDFVVEFWAYPTTTAAGLRTMLHMNAGGIAGLHIYQSGATLNVDNGLASAFGSGSVLTANTWHYIAVSRNGSTINTFLNGARLDSRTAQSYGTPNAAWVGRFYGNASYVFTGYLDELRIANTSSGFTGSTVTVPTGPFANP